MGGGAPEADTAARRNPARAAFLWSAMAAAVALGLHLVATPYHFVFDDGAIALRYAVRIATGEGFSYGGGEAVHGASPVLAVAASAGLVAAGSDLYTAVRLCAGLSLVAAAALLTWVCTRRFGPGTAVLGLVLLLATPFHNFLLHDGLEAPFLLLLMTGLWASLDRRRPVVQGLLLGLLVQNKVDAALAAVVYAADRTVRDRKFPLLATVVALASCAPLSWWLLSEVGTVMPHSGVHKVTVHENRAGFDPLWMVQQVGREAWLAAALALAGLLWVPGWRRSAPTVVLGLWAVLHLGFFSAVDMGDTFRWYAAQPAFAALLIAVESVGRLERRAADAGRGTLRAGLLPALAAVVFVATVGGRELGRMVTSDPTDPELPSYQHANLGLQAAGAWLRMNTSGTERLAVTHGFPALEYGGPVVDLTGLNSPADARDTLEHAYSITYVDPALVAAAGTRTVPGYVTLASFRFGPKHEAFVLARPSSEAARAGRVAATHDPLEYLRATDGEATVGSNRVDWVGPGRVDLAVPAPTPTVLSLRVDSSAPADSRVRVLLDGGELGSAGPGEKLLLSLDNGRTAAAATLSLEATGVGPGEALGVRDFLLRTGEPIRSGDLRLVSPRQAARVDAYAERGLLGLR